MKKVLAILLALAMTFCLAACGDTGTSDSSSSSSSSSKSSASSTADDSSEDEVVGDGRFDSLQRVDETVNLLLYWHNLQPTINETPTEEAPTVRNACRNLTAQWLEMYPEAVVEWCRNLEMTEEWCTVNYTAGAGPDTLFYWGGKNWAEKGWVYYLDEVMQSQNYYETGSPKWYDMFPEYCFDDTEMCLDAYDRIVAVPVILNPGPATAYYYNADIFAEFGFEPTTSWKELKDMIVEFKAGGYTADVPYSLCKTPNAGTWDAQFSLNPVYLYPTIADNDYDGDGSSKTGEVIRKQYETGYWYLENNPRMVEYWDELLWKFWNGFDEGVKDIDYTKPWAEGKVAMWEEGLWSLIRFMSDTTITFKVGMFPPPLQQAADSEFVTAVEYTEAGPYNPSISVAFNVMEPSLQDRPDYNVDYVVDWMKWCTTADNLSIQIEEGEGVIGAVKGCKVPGTLTNWFSQSFPKLPTGYSYLRPDMSETTTASFTAILEEYGYKMIDKETWIKKYDELFYQAMQDYIKNEGDKIAEYSETYGWDADDWSDPMKPSWM